MKLSAICDMHDGLELIKDADIDTMGLATSDYPGERVLSFLENEKYLENMLNNNAISAIICSDDVYKSTNIPSHYGVLINPHPKKAFFQLHNILAATDFYWQKFDNKISVSAQISEHAVISSHSIEIGENCIIEPGVVIYPGTIIGNNVIIRSGTKVGSVGFQFVSDEDKVFAVESAGRVLIKDHVEIQHNTCIDRGVLGGDTVLDEYVKVDNFVHIAHDAYIGKRTFIVAGVKLGGRVITGEDCWLGINATVSNGIRIGDNSKVSLGAVVTRDVPPNTTVSGNFAIEHRKLIQHIKTIR